MSKRFPIDCSEFHQRLEELRETEYIDKIRDRYALKKKHNYNKASLVKR